MSSSSDKIDPMPVYEVSDIKSHVENGASVVLVDKIVDDVVAWSIEAHLSNGLVLQLYTKPGGQVRVFKNFPFLHKLLEDIGHPYTDYGHHSEEMAAILAFQTDRQDRVAAKAKSLGVSQSKLAEELECSVAGFHYIVSGEIRDAEKEEKLCERLGLELKATFPTSIVEHLRQA